MKIIGTVIFLSILFFLINHKVEAQDKIKESSIMSTKDENTISVKEIESITRNMVDENIMSSMAEEKLKIANTTITYSSIITGVVIFVFTLIFGLLAYLGHGSLKETRKEIEEIRKVRVTMGKELGIMKDRLNKENENLQTIMKNLKEAEETHNELKETSYDIRSRFGVHIGYAYWEISRALTLNQEKPLSPEQNEQMNMLLNYAIAFTETALNAPPDKETLRKTKQISLAQGKINLAYYYAALDENKRKKYKEIAIKYAEEVKEKIPLMRETSLASSISNWLADYAYVIVRFATSHEEINQAILCVEQIAASHPEIEITIKNILDYAKAKKNEYILLAPFRAAQDQEKIT